MFTQLNKDVLKETSIEDSFKVLLNGIADRLDAIAHDSDAVKKTSKQIRNSVAEFLNSLQENLENPIIEETEKVIQKLQEEAKDLVPASSIKKKVKKLQVIDGKLVEIEVEE